jgi:hypothetical protein
MRNETPTTTTKEDTMQVLMIDWAEDRQEVAEMLTEDVLNLLSDCGGSVSGSTLMDSLKGSLYGEQITSGRQWRMPRWTNCHEVADLVEPLGFTVIHERRGNNTITTVTI